jgi:hypothetical protein
MTIKCFSIVSEAVHSGFKPDHLTETFLRDEFPTKKRFYEFCLVCHRRNYKARAEQKAVGMRLLVADYSLSYYCVLAPRKDSSLRVINYRTHLKT